MAYQLADAVNKDRVFLVKRSELEGRLDPSFNSAKKRNQITSIYPKIPIGKLCYSLTGGTPCKDNPDFWIGSIPWISPKDFKQFYLNDSVDHISEEAIRDSSTRLVPENSVVIVVRSGVLIHTIPVAVTLKPMSINQDIKALVFCDKVLPAFAAYYIHVFQQKILPLVTKHSTTVQSINTEQFEKLDLVVPPITIQQNVIAKMNTAYAAKKQKEAQALKLLDSIDTYLLHELGIELPVEEENCISKRMFVHKFSEVSGGRFDPVYFEKRFTDLIQKIQQSSFQFVPLGTVCSLLCSGKTPARDEYSEEPTSYPIIKVASYSGDLIDLQKTNFAVSKQPYTVEKGDIFVLSAAHQADYVGRFVKQLEDDPEIQTSFVGELICFRANNTIINPYYLFGLFTSKTFQTLMNREKRGQTSHIYSNDIKHILIPLPPLEKQNEIADHIQTIRDQAKQLRAEAAAGLEQAKREVEAMILGQH